MDTPHLKQSYIVGVIFMILSVFGLALTGLFGKFAVLDYPISPVLFYRFLFAFLLYFLILWLMGRLKGGLHITNVKIHILRAIFSLGSVYFFYMFIKKHSLLNGVTLLNTGPLFIPLIERIFMGQKIHKLTGIAIIIAFVGVFFILKPDRTIFSNMIGLLGGLFQGASQVIFGLTAKSEKPDISVLYLFFLYVVFSLCPYLFSTEPLTEKDSNLWWFAILAVALGLSTIVNQFFRAMAYKHSTPTKLAAFLYIAVIFAALFDWMFFNNPPDLFSVIGALLVVAGGVIKIYIHSPIFKRSKT